MVSLDVDEAGTQAAAMIAGVAVGIYPTYHKAVEMFVNPKKEYYPNHRAKAVYDENFQHYKKLYQALRSI